MSWQWLEDINASRFQDFSLPGFDHSQPDYDEVAPDAWKFLVGIRCAAEQEAGIIRNHATARRVSSELNWHQRLTHELVVDKSLALNLTGYRKSRNASWQESAKDTLVKLIPQPSEKLPCTVPTHFFPNQHLLLLSPIHPVAWRVAFVLTVYKSGGVGSRIGVQPVPSEIASSVRCVLCEPDPESDDHAKYRADADCICIQLPCERVALQLSTVDEVYTNDFHSFKLSADGLKACQNTKVLHDDSKWIDNDTLHFPDVTKKLDVWMWLLDVCVVITQKRCQSIVFRKRAHCSKRICMYMHRYV